MPAKKKSATALDDLAELPPFEWPDGTRERVLAVLKTPDAPARDRVTAASLAGDSTIVDDEIVMVLTAIVADARAATELRAAAAIALGPVLELADTEYLDDEPSGADEDDDGEDDGDRDAGDDFDDDLEAGADEEPTITRVSFAHIKTTLRKVFRDVKAPVEVRRAALEAAVRAPEDWQNEVVRTAWADTDVLWKCTAVFAASYLRGFESLILEALTHDDEDVRRNAVYAAGNRELDAAWPHVLPLATSRATSKSLRLTAIEALGCLRPREATAVLTKLLSEKDEEIVATVEEALAMAEVASDADLHKELAGGDGRDEDDFDDDLDGDDDDDDDTGKPAPAPPGAGRRR